MTQVKWKMISYHDIFLASMFFNYFIEKNCMISIFNQTPISLLLINDLT